MTNFTYKLPSKIVFAINALEQLDTYVKGRKTLLITSPTFIKNGTVERLKKLTPQIIEVVTNTKSHPEFVDLKHTYSQVHQQEYELILALGGGSVLDAAKFYSVYNIHKDAEFVEGLIKNKSTNKNYKTLPIIAIPTTAGTSSEITPWATIWDMQEKKKYSLHLPELFSEVAIYDPSLTVSLPKDITIQTGLDALSHALESIWNKNASPITVSHAVTAAKLIVEYLPKLTQDLTNLDYRSKLFEATLFAGLAFSNTQTALAHAMSYYITANKGVPHGLACSFTLPKLIDEIAGKYTFIDKALIDIFGDASSTKLREMLAELNIATDFASYGLTEDEVKELYSSLGSTQRAGNSLIIIE